MNFYFLYIILLSIIIATIISTFITYILNKSYFNKLSKNFIIIPKKSKIKKSRKRYLVFEIATSKQIDPGLLENAIREKYKELFGATNLADSYLKLIYFNNVTNRGIIRIKHIYVDYLLSSLSLLRKIDNNDILIIPIKTSGTINKAKKLLS
ncbi:Rpp14/Pop5 family protein [Caldisphaera sp.]|mgnify:CR=1|uniref:Rpp14/Pop5 family protein n=1 Tax=Caldisphaera sp. TaxID=2060322 RepID=UPI0025C6C8EF|nr:Rpp14/Pop5 family protein [Caldisphaera sp.]